MGQTEVRARERSAEAHGVTPPVGKPGGQLGELLLSRGLITEEQLDMARHQASQRGRSLGRIVIEMGFVTEGGLVAILAEQLGLEFIDLTETAIDASAVAAVPETTARRH